MKRKLGITVAGVVLLSSALAWLSRPSPASPDQDFSPADFRRIQQVTRSAVWRTALPDFTIGTVRALPRWCWRLGSSHIRRIDVLPAGTVNVEVESPSGRYYYLVEKYEKSGRWDWRVTREGVWPRGARVINLNGGPGYPEIRVDGGFALFGGRISSEPPADWLPPAARRGLMSSGEQSTSQAELSVSGSNQVRPT